MQAKTKSTFTSRKLLGDPPLSEYCSNPSLRASLLVEHAVTENAYTFMAQLFSPAGLLPPKSIDVASVINYMSGKDCMSNNILFQVDFDDDTSNSDIELYTASDINEPSYVTYSIAFFNAILEVFNNDNNLSRFEISKAISDMGDDNGHSLVIKVIDTSEQTVYCADLSGVYP